MTARRAVLRGLQLSLLGALVLAGVLLWRAARVPSRQASAPPAPALAIDGAEVARHLAGSLRFPTISRGAGADPDAEAFAGLHRYLETTYPRVHAALRRETVAGYSLLYTWPGRDLSLRPALLMAHQDVVPIEAASAADWTHPPFAGRIADGFVWGRGAIDNKNDVVCILEAVEALLADGFQPGRTIYLAFGHDEEVGGNWGAAAVAALLEARGVELEYVLDEGGGFVVGALPYLPGPVAPIAIAEKGSVSFDLVVEAKGGHSSIPPRHTAPGILAAAVKRLEDHPMPGHLGETTRLSLAYLSPELPFPVRIALANLWLFRAPLLAAAARDPVMDALVRTTTAVTMLESGVKPNVVPARALAVVNHRILPGDRVEDVRAHVRRTVDDERVAIEVGRHGEPREPSPVSRTDSEAFAVIQHTVAEVFPDATLLPALSVGGTDARHFYGLSDSVYRLTPLVAERTDLSRAHGVNERAPVAALADAVRFYARLIRSSASAAP